jgi:hypothetical protein
MTILKLCVVLVVALFVLSVSGESMKKITIGVAGMMKSKTGIT